MMEKIEAILNTDAPSSHHHHHVVRHWGLRPSFQPIFSLVLREECEEAWLALERWGDTTAGTLGLAFDAVGPVFADIEREDELVPGLDGEGGFVPEAEPGAWDGEFEPR